MLRHGLEVVGLIIIIIINVALLLCSTGQLFTVGNR